MAILKCESKNPDVENGVQVEVGRTFDKDDIKDAENDAERGAIEKGFDDAMSWLDEYDSEGDCEKRFSATFRKIRAVNRLPQKVNGARLYEVVVSVKWILDIDCVPPRHGKGTPKGRTV
jgi:hypothetical protein